MQISNADIDGVVTYRKRAFEVTVESMASDESPTASTMTA
jgi:hypothetical protein